VVRQLILAGATLSLLGLLVACGGGGGEPASITPAPGIASGPSSQAAPGEGTFLIDLSTDGWIQVLPTFDKYLNEVSPDGETILYGAKTAELFAVDADGSNRRKIADGFVEAAFSPDGKTLAMWGQDRPLTLMDWPDGEPVEAAVSTDVREAVWSSKNELAVFTGEQTSAARDLYLVSHGGTAERVAGGDFAFRASPRWAPDGSRLAFADETSVYTVTPGEEAEVFAQFRDVGVRSVSWSSDGALLAVGVDRRAVADPGYEATDIVVIDATTSERRFTLVGAGFFDPLWSPVEPVLLFDGNACLFEEWQLMLVNGDGTDLRPLTERHGGFFFAGYDWSPDGRRVATGSVERGAITTVDVETGEAQSVFRSPGILAGLRWVTGDRLIVTAIGGTDACSQSLGEETRVVFP
jgi:Tol biopolymer transport system component